MKRFLNALVLFVGSAFLIGCNLNTIKIAYKENSTLAQINQVVLDCQVEATQKVPVNNMLVTRPSYQEPVSCTNHFGRVDCSGGNSYGGGTFSLDANSNLRSRYVEQCLYNKGYVLTDFPVCDQNEISELKTRRSKKEKLSLDVEVLAPKASCAFFDDGKIIQSPRS